MPLPSCYSSLQIPPYIGLGCPERDEPGFMPLVDCNADADIRPHGERHDHRSGCAHGGESGSVG